MRGSASCPNTLWHTGRHDSNLTCCLLIKGRRLYLCHRSPQIIILCFHTRTVNSKIHEPLIIIQHLKLSKIPPLLIYCCSVTLLKQTNCSDSTAVTRFRQVCLKMAFAAIYCGYTACLWHFALRHDYNMPRGHINQVLSLSCSFTRRTRPSVRQKKPHMAGMIKGAVWKLSPFELWTRPFLFWLILWARLVSPTFPACSPALTSFLPVSSGLSLQTLSIFHRRVR